MTEESNGVSPVLKADWFDSRWGKEDQRGNGNLMTREKVARPKNDFSSLKGLKLVGSVGSVRQE